MTDPGIHRNMPFADYRAIPAVNASTLIPGLHGPAKAMLAAAEGRLDKPSKAKDDGTAAHSLTLETLQTVRTMAVMPDYENDPENVTAKGERPKSPRATAYYKAKVKEFEAFADKAGKTVIAKDTFDRLCLMHDAIRAKPSAAAMLDAPGEVEVVVVWQDQITGLMCKGRLDKWFPSDGVVLDLKTTTDASPAGFVKSLYRWSYHIRAAYYCDGLLANGHAVSSFQLLAVEPAEPFGVSIAPINGDWLELGRELYLKLLWEYAQCKQAGVWPDYEDPTEWAPEPWMLPETTLVVDGRTVTL